MGEPGERPKVKVEGGTAGGAKRRRRRRRPKRAAAPASGEAASSATPRTAKASPEGGENRGQAQKSTRKKDQKQRKRQKPRGASAKKPSGRKPSGRKKQAAPTKREISAGGVVYRRDGEEIEVVLASRRTRRGELAWGLAKGGIEEDESTEDAAVREVREETGMTAEIEASLGETRYFYVWEDVRIRKTVHFFLMRHTGGNVEDRDDEMEEIRWFPLERALKRAAYRGERDVLGRAAEMLR
jgi:8-oxo-dGTP pyrophosphatase MutT (NUDIX family)